MWRFVLEKSHPPLILPFRLGDVRADEIDRDEFSATFINEMQAPALDDGALADEVVARLKTLSIPGPTNSSFRKIENAIASKLAGLDSADLDLALDALDVAPGAFEPYLSDTLARKRLQLAAALLDVDLPRLGEFLKNHAPKLTNDAGKFLVNWVASFRVDEIHGSTVFKRSIAKPREVAITSRYPLTGRHYVARAHLRPLPPKVPTVVLRINEEESHEAGIQSILSQVEDVLRENGIKVETRAELKNYLKRAQVVRFLAIRLHSDDPTLRRRLQEEFDNVTFLFFTRNDQGQVVSLSGAETVEIDQERDDDFCHAYLDALELVSSEEHESR